jgi:uncharacterized protein (AIM24 family)
MIHGDFTSMLETTGQDPFTLHNKKLLKVFLAYGPVIARLGSMVAYQGDAKFEYQGAGGASKWLKGKLTGEALPIMNVTGTGEVFLADAAREIQVLYLEDDAISVNGANLLAISASVAMEIERVGGAGAMAGGMYNTSLRGTGYVAITTDGPPIVFDVAQGPVATDGNAVVAWTSGVQKTVKADVNLKTLIGKDSGESIQLHFSGQGYVVVQPSENVPRGGGQQAGSGGFLGL